MTEGVKAQLLLEVIGPMCHTVNMAIRSYYDSGTKDIALRQQSKESRKVLPEVLHRMGRKKLFVLASATSLADLKKAPGLNLHSLQKDRKGQFAIRINDQYRICFRWSGADADRVEITDYH